MAIFYPKKMNMQKMKHIALALVLLLSLAQCKPKETTSTTTAGTTTTTADDLTAQDVTTIKAKEIASWEFAKTKQLDKLKEIMADDYQALFGKITMGKAEVLQSFQQSNISAYRLSNIRVKKINEDAAIVYYDCLQNATDPEGDRWVPQIAAATTYVKRGGAWYSLFYHETPAMR